MAVSAQQSNDEIWSRILREVGSRDNDSEQASVIILGDEHCGKSSLVSRLTGGERPNYSSLLEYSYLTIQADPDGSYAYQLGGSVVNGGLGPADSVNLPVWILDGRDELAPMLKFAFPPHLGRCVVVLCASLEHPGNILPALRKWYRVIESQICALYPPEEIEATKQAQVRFWQEYVEPIESSMHVDALAGGARLDSLVVVDPVLLPPEHGVLDENCGVALVVVVTKSDTYTDIAAEQLDKAQYHIRQFCLRHGAALIYTSAKEDKNVQLLYKYLAHRVFSLPFTTPAYIVEKDSIFVPSGWDSEQKLAIIKETLTDLEVPMLPMQQQQTLHQQQELSELSAESGGGEDEQAFLARLAAMSSSIDGGSAGGGGGTSPRRGAGGAGADTIPTATAADNSALTNFFSSLLKKDSASVTGSPQQ